MEISGIEPLTSWLPAAIGSWFLAILSTMRPFRQQKIRNFTVICPLRPHAFAHIWVTIWVKAVGWVGRSSAGLDMDCSLKVSRSLSSAALFMIYNQISIGLAYQSYYKAHRHSRLLCCKPERSARSHNLPILLSQKQNVKGQSGKLFFAHQDQKLRFHSDSRQFQSLNQIFTIQRTALSYAKIIWKSHLIQNVTRSINHCICGIYVGQWKNCN